MSERTSVGGRRAGRVDARQISASAHDGEPTKGNKRSKARNAPKLDLRTQLFRMCGVDLTRIDGIDVTTARVVMSEVGADMSRFASVKRASRALRLAAAQRRSSQPALGAYYRRLSSRMDKSKAVTAAAREPARLIDTMLTQGQEYTDQGQNCCEERSRERVLRSLSQRAAKLDLKRVPIGQPA